MINHPAGWRHWTHRKPELLKRGTDSHAAKLSADDIAAMCVHYVAYRPCKTWLARKYSVNRITVWRHLKAAGLA